MSALPILRAVYDTLSSLKLAVAIVCGLFAVTLFGTLAQVDIGLFQAQKVYFESMWYAVPLFGGFAVPLPGGYLLMALLAVNLTLGGIVRLRKTVSRSGILVMHIGVIFMLIAGWAKYMFSQEGYVSFYPDEHRNVYTSYHDYELSVAELGAEGVTREWVVPDADIAAASDGSTCTVSFAGLPFKLRISGFERHANVLPKGPMFSVSTPVVDGYFVKPLTASKEAEMDLAACYVEVLGEGVPAQRGILWGGTQNFATEQRWPWTVRVAERTFLVDLAKRRWPLAFDVELKKFTFETLPGTMSARKYESDVIVRMPGDPDLPVKIRMNEPLRRKGLTLYQSGFGPKNSRPGDRMYSTLSVVDNPADKWPEWSLYVITLGMLVHFGQKLLRWIQREQLAAAHAKESS